MLEFPVQRLVLTVTWVILALALTGIGALVLRKRMRGFDDVLWAFWLGLAVVIFTLQIWHLFSPITAWAGALILIAGAVGIVVSRHLWLRLVRRSPTHWVLIVVFIALSGWVASRAANAEQFTDDGGYHVGEVQWELKYPIVPGLGNVQGQLAYNNAYSVWMAAIEALPLIPPAERVGNGVIILVFIATSLWSVRRVLRREAAPGDVLLLLALIPVTIHLNFASALKNDLVVAFIALVSSARVLNALSRKRGSDPMLIVDIALVVAMGISIKLSMAAYGVMLIALVIWQAAPRRRLVYIGLAISLAYIGVWAVRGAILSGYPLFPLSVIKLPVDWRMSDEQRTYEADYILAFGRNPARPTEDVLSDSSWVQVFIQRSLQNLPEVMLPLSLGAIGLALLLITRTGRRRSLLIALPPLAALMVWFFTAPDIRFAWQYFYVFGGGIFGVAVTEKPSGALFQQIALVGVILFAGDVALRNVSAYGIVRYLGYPSDGSFRPILTYGQLNLETTYHGVSLLVANDLLCWDAPLPCSSFDRPYLKMRVPGQIADGFATEPVESDRGLFSLRPILSPIDIVPPGDSQAYFNDTLVENGVLLGQGWNALELPNADRFRWVGDRAQIAITNPTSSSLTLTFETEIGPSAAEHPLNVQVENEAREVVATFQVGARAVVTITLPVVHQRVQYFTLHVPSAGTPAPNDGRILNFRVMEIRRAGDP